MEERKSSRQIDDDQFTLDDGPFEYYERELEVTSNDDGTHDVVERHRFRLDVPIWRYLLTPFVWAELRRRTRAPAMPWWGPRDRLDRISARSLSYLAFLALVSGYLGSLLSQTLGFAGFEFGQDSSSQSALAAWVRLGVPIAFAVGVFADRRGRRTAVLGAATLGCLLAAITAFSPTFFAYGVSQAVARGMSASIGMIVGIAAAEETPDGSRAYVVSILGMAGGLGSGMVVWLIPITDLDDRAWRVLFLVPLLALIPILRMWKELPETRRFARSAERLAPGEGPGRIEVLGRRFAMLAIAALLLSAFAAPASTLQTTFLREERDFSGSLISLFKLVTNTPVGIGLFIAGRLADAKGRRMIGAFGLTAGVVFTALEFSDSGNMIWVWGLLGTVLGASALPALGVYGPEMFGTRSRSRSNALLLIVGTIGSAAGLGFASWSLDRYSFGTTFAMLAVAPLTVAVLVVVFFPETAQRSLEDINPQDATD